MTFWLIAIAVALLIWWLGKENSTKAAQVLAERERLQEERELLEEERERLEDDRLNAEEQRKYDSFFAANGYPHHNDKIRILAWAEQRDMSLEEARDFFWTANSTNRSAKCWTVQQKATSLYASFESILSPSESNSERRFTKSVPLERNEMPVTGRGGWLAVLGFANLKCHSEDQ
jgi:hypothetical protein